MKKTFFFLLTLFGMGLINKSFSQTFQNQTQCDAYVMIEYVDDGNNSTPITSNVFTITGSNSLNMGTWLADPSNIASPATANSITGVYFKHSIGAGWSYHAYSAPDTGAIPWSNTCGTSNFGGSSGSSGIHCSPGCDCEIIEN